MMFKDSFTRIFLFLFLGISTLLFWGCKGASEKQVEGLFTPLPFSLRYKFEVLYEDESVKAGSVSAEDLDGLLYQYCTDTHPTSDTYNPFGDVRFSPSTFEVDYYSRYRKFICNGDALLEMANKPNGVILDRYPKIGACQFEIRWSLTFLQNAGIIQNENSSPGISIHFKPLVTMGHKHEVMDLSILRYNEALLIIRDYFDGVLDPSAVFISGAELRTHMYNSDGDVCFSSDPEVNKSAGAGLVDQMFGSYPSIIDTIKKIKMDCAEDMMLEGAGEDDEWGSEEHGRLPALRHMIGSVRIHNSGQGTEYDDIDVIDLSLLPNNFQFPKMTNSLKSAISLLARQNILPTANINALDLNSVMYTVNTRRKELGQFVFTKPSDMAEDYGTSLLGLKEAYQYMYSHMIRFPRIPSQATGYPEWTNPKIASPPSFHIRDFFTRWNNDTTDDPFYDQIDLDGKKYTTVLTNTGLTTHLTSIERKHYASLNVFIQITNGISDEALITEENILMHYNAGASVLRNALGKKRIIYRLLKIAAIDSNDFQLIRIEVKNPDVDNDTGESLDKIRIYPIGETEGPDQLSAFACAHLANDDPDIDTQCDAILENIYEISLDTCEVDALDGTNKCYNDPGYSLSTNNGADGSQYWMVEMKTEAKVLDGEEEIGTWYPVGVLANDSYFFEESPSPGFFVKHGMFQVEGRIRKAVSKILAFDETDLSGSMCVPVNGLDYTCLDRDWIPAIDNEVIDAVGNKYEDSYRHYLGLARAASLEARQMRERLMNDLLSETHEKSLMEAQYHAALDKYLSNIVSICGQDNIISDFENIVEDVFTYASPENFENELLERISVYYGCKANCKDTVNATHNYKRGPVHCYVHRNCNVENPITLGKLGILNEESTSVGGAVVGPGNSGEANSEDGTNTYPLPGYFPLDEDTSNELKIGAEGSASEPSAETGSNTGVAGPVISTNNMVYPGPVLKEMTTGDFDEIDQSFKGMTAFAQQYPAHAKWVMQSEPLYMFPKDIKGIMNSFGGSKYGRFYEALAEMGITIEKIKSLAESLIAEMYNALYLTKMLHDSVMLNDAQGALQTAQADMILKQQIASALLQGMLFFAQLEDNERKCLEDINAQYGKGKCLGCDDWDLGDPNTDLDDYCKGNCELQEGPRGKSLDDFVQALNSINELLISHSLRKLVYGDVNSKGEFVANCIKAAGISGDPILTETKEHPTKICNFLADKYWGGPPHSNIWFEENDFPAGYYYLHREKNCHMEYVLNKEECYYWDEGIQSTTIVNGKKIIIYPFPGRHSNQNCPAIAIRCEKGPYSYDDKMDRFLGCRWPERAFQGRWYDVRKTITNEFDEPSDVFEWDFCLNYSFRLIGKFGGKNGMAAKLRDMLRNWENENCIRKSGCRDVIGGVDYPDVYCDGAASDATTAAYLEWIKLMAVDDALGIQELKDKIDAVTYWKYELMNDKYQQDITTSAKNFSAVKHEIWNLIKELAIKNSQVARLEDEQISHFYTFINDLSVAYASSYSTLTEWQERYDFRKEEYKKQLKRARIAAWVARRAIEFRFGIDLSKEDMRTIHGEKPSDWANDIYKSAVSTCGDEESQNSMTGCLSQEDRIEEYIQKLEDYVESYGNSPYQGWWVHEDDDTGIISLRDHMTARHLSGGMVTNNLLYFSEEMDMDNVAFDETYLIENGLSDDYFTDYPDPAFWDNQGISIYSEEDAEGKDIGEYLGIPKQVFDAHNTNEQGLFEDQIEDLSAELLQSAPGIDVQLSQTLLEQIGGRRDLDFSMFIRKNPIDKTSEDCEDNETFFPGIGRCGVECEIYEDSPIKGDCEEGQVCMYASQVPNEETEEMDIIQMCDWCSADRGCIYQDGQALQLGLTVSSVSQDEENEYKKNITAYPFWARQNVDTIDYLYETSTGVVDDQVKVSIKNTKTKNLAPSSERVDEDRGWYFWNPNTQVLGQQADIVAPDGTIGVDELGNEVEFQLRIPIPPDHQDGYYTGSIWLKRTDSSEPIKGLIGIFPGVLFEGYKEIEVTDEWKRFEVIQIGGPSSGELVTQINIDPFDTETETIAVWGAQIEVGAGATPYIPTGKNLLADSADFYKWIASPSSGTSIETSDDRGPAGTGGVYKITDTIAGWSNRHLITYGNYSDVEKATSSIWVKSGDENTHCTRLYMQQWDASGNLCKGDYADLTADNSWKRLTVTDNIADCDSPNNVPPVRINVTIQPEGGCLPENTGSILVWGPQLEKGEFATGYQETVAKNLLYVSNDITRWSQTIVNNDCYVTLSDDQNYPDGATDNGGIYKIGYPHNIYQYIGGTFREGETYTYSIWLKKPDADVNPDIANVKLIPLLNDNPIGDDPYQIHPDLTTGWTRHAVNMTLSGYGEPGEIVADQLAVYVNAPHNAAGTAFAYGPQVEKGYSPTEYQPTGGPPNILPDGDMEDTTPCDAVGCGYWIAGADAALSKQPDGNGGQVLRVTYQTSPDSYAEQQNITEFGKRYRISGRVKSYNGGRVGITNDSGAYLWTEPDPVNVDWIDIDFTYEANSYAIQLANASTSGYSEFDDIRIVNIAEPDPTRVDSYEKEWGLDIGVVGAQLTPVNTYPCDEDGNLVLINATDSEHTCNDRHTSNRADCCARPWIWYGQGTHELFYQACMTCGDSGQPICADIAEGDARACDPVELCENYAEEIDAKKCTHGPTAYNRNTYLTEHIEPGFEVSKVGDMPYPLPINLHTYVSKETRQRLFKSQFKYFPSPEESDKPGYYAYWFNMNMDDIESGSLGQFGVLAPNNFNYRIRTVATNIVGTDVINCSSDDTPETCAENDWIPYDLKQMGEVSIRNHHEDLSVRKFKIPTGRVSGGKAWVSEQVIGYPVSGAHLGALSQLQKVSLMGRPLQGTYELRIYDTPELTWPNIEDVQIVLGYHYWTRSE